MAATDKVVLVVGDTGVGKTTLVRKLSGTNFGDANPGLQVRAPFSCLSLSLRPH